MPSKLIRRSNGRARDACSQASGVHACSARARKSRDALHADLPEATATRG
jgi:hypothetical protein